MKKILKLLLWLDKYFNPLKTPDEWKKYHSREQSLTQKK